MKKLAFLIAVALLLPASAFAGDISASEYVREHNWSQRADGPFQRRDSYGFDLIVNGAHNGSIGKAVYEDFSEYGDGDSWCYQSDLTACSGTAGEINYVVFPSGNKLGCISMGTQTILGGLDMDAGSLDISGDQTDNDGVDCAWGLGEASGGTFTVGTDAAFFTCMQFSITETDGTDEFHFGWRQADDLWNQTYDNYTDLASFSIITAANPADLQTSSIANNGATSETDTTVNIDDEDRVDLCVFVSSAGVTTFYYDDAATAGNSFSRLKPAPAAESYTFTDAESLVPFFHILQANADQTDGVQVYEWVTGYGTFPLSPASN